MALVKKHVTPTRVLYLSFAIFYFWMAAQVPYTHDDWEWGIPTGIHYLTTGNINGRYLGNLLMVIMTRWEPFKIFVLGSCYFALPWLMAHFASDQDASQKPIAFLVANLLILTMPTIVWKQTYGWVSGFANFVISAVFAMTWVREITLLFRQDPPGKRPWQDTLLCTLLALLGQLFLENLALCLVLLGLVLCAVAWRRTGKLPIRQLCMTAGALIGLMILFSSSLYDTLFTSGQAIAGYRKVPLFSGAGMETVLKQMVAQMLALVPWIYQRDLSVTLAIPTLLALLTLARKDRHSPSTWLFCLLDLGFLLLFWLSRSLPLLSQPWVSFFCALFYFLAVCCQIWCLFSGETWQKWKLLLLWTTIPLVIAPLVVTSETGQRLFFTTHAFSVLFALLLLSQLLKAVPKSWCRPIAALALIAVLPVLLHFGNVYYEIGDCQNQRDALIDWANEYGAFTVEFPRFPHAQYLWIPDPEPYYDPVFRGFYGLVDYIEITYCDYQRQ